MEYGVSSLDKKEIAEIEYEYNHNSALTEKGNVPEVITEYLKAIGKYKILSKEEELEYAIRYKETGDKSAKEALINHNLKLVVYVAKKYNYQNLLSLMDLIQEGNIGLMTAIERYDYNVGCKFSTYAIWWIRQAIKRAIANTDTLIRLPVHVKEKTYAYKKWKNEYVSEFSKEPSKDECNDKLQELGIPADCMYDIMYLDTPIGEDQDTTLAEVIADETQSCDKEVNNLLMKNDLFELLNSILSEKELEMLKLRYGLDDDKPRTLQEVADVYGVTRERVRQVTQRALNKLKFSGRFKTFAEDCR